jgi:hypothetical protein
MKANTASQSIYQIAATALTALLLVGLVGYTAVTLYGNSDNDLPPVVAFQFETYCPIDSSSKLALINEQLALQGVPPLDFDYHVNPNIYVVNAQSRPSDPSNPNSSVLLYYCGLAKKWWDASCSNARFICSIPGPMFYFPVKQ